MIIKESKTVDSYEAVLKLRDVIRLDTLKMLQHMGYGHIGGSMSIVELLAVLYGKQMRIDNKNPDWGERDRLVLSKGHAGPALYATLANKGFFPHDWLFTLNEGGTNLPSHPDRLKIPGVDATTGSLGQGTSIAAGIATGLRLSGSDAYTYLIVGDGELNEGQCWEAFQFIAHQKLTHCIVFIDDNKKQLDGYTADIINQFDIQKKLESFGFMTLKVKGNDLKAIDDAINFLKDQEDTAVAIVLDTIKSQGVPFFENLHDNHSVKFNTERYQIELQKAIDELAARVTIGGENHDL
ncbi:transketolase [Lactococcus piscium]|jgi:transketolase|uniref:transketolase n=1 Tax=Pseudolactococcus carnosus TaxID=2749961 RepID=UPI00237A2E46|nr:MULTISPECIES: transketolase [Lactococcus]MBR6894671.1 transketolase [Lactococcus sp.]MCJ1991219.1 transketolase [Lactococcus carnosus]MCJ2000847.1 transketolase [Lactococcus carnosus]